MTANDAGYATGAEGTAFAARDRVNELLTLLTRAHLHICGGESHEAFAILGRDLSWLFASCKTDPERGILVQAAREHPLFSDLMQDPYSRRAFEKPRGYAGDAVMLDFVYNGRAPEGTSSIGVTVFGGTARGPMGLSVVYRRTLLAAYLAQTLVTTPSARVLSVASGHLRELEGIDFESPWAGDAEIVAIDQDQESCETVSRVYPGNNVSVINDSIRLLLSKKASSLGQFDFVYSAGLLDYLDTGLATRLTECLAERLAPGGKLLIANFLPDSFGRAYMELFLDWKLIYRSLDEVVALSRHPNLTLSNRFSDPHGNVGYVEWTRRR